MDIIITFFRDILDGPLYIIIAVICGVLFCACIGYLAEKSQLKRKEREKYVEVKNESVAINSQVPPVAQVTTSPSVSPQVVTMPTNNMNSSVESVPVSQSPYVIPTQVVSTLQASPTVSATTVAPAPVDSQPTTVVQPIPMNDATQTPIPESVVVSSISVPGNAESVPPVNQG